MSRKGTFGLGAITSLAAVSVLALGFVGMPGKAALAEDCNDGDPNSADIHSLEVEFVKGATTAHDLIKVEVTLCAAPDTKTKYRVHFDHTAPFAIDDDRNGDGEVNDADFCVGTSDRNMKRHGDKNTGPGDIVAAGTKLTFSVLVDDLNPLLTEQDTVYIWAAAKKKGNEDRAPDTDASNGCAEPEKESETIALKLAPPRKIVFATSQTIDGALGGASGLTDVWARDNTRGDIFDAMKRIEVYAMTGTRIRVRVFGGWDFEAHEVSGFDFVAQGYRRGVPMGGSLTQGPNGKAPSFLIRAVRDPDGANLDRVQVIKVWLDDAGQTHEKIYDVVCSDARGIKNSRCEAPIGNTVDVEKATYSNSIGDAYLSAHWEDLGFDPAERAFYYVRVLEIPTPRWTTYDAAFYGIDRPNNVPATLQGRAYTSPIWYTP